MEKGTDREKQRSEIERAGLPHMGLLISKSIRGVPAG